MVNKFTVALAGDDLGTFDENELTLDDAFILERTAHMTFTQMLQGARIGLPDELRALVWFMKLKRGDGVDILSINFKLTELVTEAVEDPSPVVAPRVKKLRATSPSSDTSSA